MELVSVVMPAFNRSETIERAVNSVLNQTHKNIELIVVDDCSTDDTEEVVRSIKDKRLKFIKLSKNSGACIARNKGIDLANGEYIAFLDSDDEWMLNKLEKQIAFLEDNEFDMVYSAYLRHSGFKKKTNKLPANVQISKSVYEGMLIEPAAITSTILIKSEIIKKNKFDENLPRLQEYDLCLRLAKNYSIGFQNEVLANVYLQKDSITYQTGKLITALNYLYEKNKTDIESNKDALNSWAYRIAVAHFKGLNHKGAVYKELYRKTKNKKIALLRVLAFLHLNKIIIKTFSK